MPECAFYNADELAQVLGFTKKTILNKLCREPESLPPSVKIGRGRVFKRSTVEEWIDNLPEGHLH